MGCAYFDEEGRLTIHSKSIALYLHALMIADGLGIDSANIRMVQNTRAAPSDTNSAPPVRRCWRGLHGHQPAGLSGIRLPAVRHLHWQALSFFTTVKMGADASGKLLAMETDWIVDHGAYSEFGDLLTHKGAQFIARVTTFPAFAAPEEQSAPTTPGVPLSWIRRSESEFASESLMDELAEKLGMDPLEFRYKNVYRPEPQPPPDKPPKPSVWKP
jgi:aldehyde oxidoreductase